jgi:hypothetical protein
MPNINFCIHLKGGQEKGKGRRKLKFLSPYEINPDATTGKYLGIN